MDDILEKLDRLNDVQLAKVVKLIDKLAAKSGAPEPAKAAPQVAQAPITHTIKKTESKVVRLHNRASLRDLVDQPSHGPRRGLDTTPAGSTSIRTKHGKVRVGRGQAKVQARREPIHITENRPNNFLTMQEAQLHKEDSEVDKKLWKGRQPTPRAREALSYEIECNECQRVFEVSQQEIFVDEEGDAKYTCDACISSKGRR